jgi:hypothetical protein
MDKKLTTEEIQQVVHQLEANKIKPMPIGKEDYYYICPMCGSLDAAKIKGCIRCLKCGFKEDCNGW